MSERAIQVLSYTNPDSRTDTTMFGTKVVSEKIGLQRPQT